MNYLREEAIDIIVCLAWHTRPDEEDIEQAIKVLEKEPCEDAISRKALIERINNAEENFKVDNMDSISSDEENPFVDGVLSGVFNIRQMVAQAPSCEPARKKGGDLMLTVNELFAGIGAFHKALDRLGIPYKIVGISEIDKYAIASYNALYGETRNYGDISKVDKLEA